MTRKPSDSPALIRRIVHAAAPVVLALGLAAFTAPEPQDDIDLVHMAERYCIGPDGDHEWTWALAEHDGYRTLGPEDFPNLRLPGLGQLRGHAKTVGDIELQVLVARNRYVGPSEGENHFRLCWVSASPADRRAVDAEVRHLLGVRRFRMDGAFAYAWSPQDDGSRRSIRRKDFNRYGMGLSRTQNMRMLLTNDYQGMVAITYLSPDHERNAGVSPSEHDQE